MQIWIDGDACPKAIKQIIFRAAIRTKTPVMVVSNHPLIIPPSPLIKKYQVGSGFDVADQHIVQHMQPGDLVITADIPLADEVITQGGFALNPRGEFYSANNIKRSLAMRNLNESLRSCQVLTSSMAAISQKDVRLFANNLDKFIANASS